MTIVSVSAKNFEFTPKEIGKIKFSCSMGMYSGYFDVVDGDEIDFSDTSDANESLKTCNVNGCGVSSNSAKQSNVDEDADNNIAGAQVIKTTYTVYDDIQPSTFTVKAGKPVRFEIFVKEEGAGCMWAIMIPGLYDNYKALEKGKTIVMNFTPTKKGEYPITCSMGMERGLLKVE